jgi:hypothetical protein
MRWTFVVPGALLPSSIAADVLAAARTPWLKATLARAQAGEAEAGSGLAPHLDWLWQQFGGTGEPVTAPYALRALDPAADPGAQCWHVDPVHFAFARDHLLVSPLDEAPSAAEQDVLAGHLRAALDDLGLPAEAALHRHGDRWLLSLAAPWRLRATPLEAAMGQSALEHWPTGEDSRAWRRLLTDVQMRWHAEALNEEREASGRPAVNALWLHGGGPWRPLPSQPFGIVASSDPVLRGWAMASGIDNSALFSDGQIPRATADAVSIARDLLVPAQFEAWGLWIDRLQQLENALRELHDACFAAGYKELTLVLCGRRRIRIARVRHHDAWRLWRRTPATPLLAEAE